MSGPTSTFSPVRPASSSRLLRALVRDWRSWYAAIVFGTATFVSLFGPLLAPYPLGWADINLSMGAPSDGHLLGLNRDGEDILSLLVYATSSTLAGMLITVVVALSIGVASGLLAGFFRGTWFDGVASWTANLVLAIPAILILIAVRGLVGPSLLLNMGIFGVLLSPVVFRIVQSSVAAVRTELFVDAARVNGLTTGVILGTHILSVVRGPIIIQAAFLAAAGVAIQAGLEFLGIGDPSSTTWGAMLSDGFAEIYQQPLQMLWPALAIGLFCGAAILLGNALTDGFGRPEVRVPSRRALERLAAQQTEQRPQPTQPNSDAAISIRGLRVSYKTPRGIGEVVHGVDLDLLPGRVLGLVGESGSGKTQTVLSCLGLLPSGGFVSGGTIFVGGEDLGALSPRERRRVLGVRVGYIPQEPLVNLDPLFTVGFHLVEPLVTRGGLSRSAARAKALALLARVGITDPERVFRSYPHQISGGMAQRVLIAGAVSLDPDILIADEPTTALDVTVQAEVLDLLRDLQAERSMSVLLVTHNLGVVADLCDEVAVMRQGVLVEHGDVRKVLRAPDHEYTRTLLAAIVEDKPPLVGAEATSVQGAAS